jgi:hypothetical protein
MIEKLKKMGIELGIVWAVLIAVGIIAKLTAKPEAVEGAITFLVGGGLTLLVIDIVKVFITVFKDYVFKKK